MVFNKNLLILKKKVTTVFKFIFRSELCTSYMPKVNYFSFFDKVFFLWINDE